MRNSSNNDRYIITEKAPLESIYCHIIENISHKNTPYS